MSLKEQLEEMKAQFKKFIDSGRRAGHDMTKTQKDIKKAVFKAPAQNKKATDPEKIANAARPTEFNALGDKAEYMKASNRRKVEMGVYESTARPVKSAEADLDGVGDSMKVGHDKNPDRNKADGKEKTRKGLEAAKSVWKSQQKAKEEMKQAQADKAKEADKKAAAQKKEQAAEKKEAMKAAQKEKERAESTK